MPDSQIDETRPNRAPANQPEATQPTWVEPGITRPVQVRGEPSEATRPMRAAPGSPDVQAGIEEQAELPQPESLPVHFMRRRWVILLGILAILLMGAAGSYLGYQAAVAYRLQNQQGQLAVQAATQYQLGLADVKEGRLEIAQQRFEYVIGLIPDFPGIKEQLSQVMVALELTRVPTEVPSPTPIPLTATPDTRSEQEQVNQILALLKDHKWADVINAIEALRAKNLSYRAVDVDGMYYIALRGRGVDKILRSTDLEGGIYDLALSERFGPLDKDALSYRTWARTYLTGASFWMVDWEKAAFYFSQVALAAPSLMDGSKQTAAERYKIALVKWGDKLGTDEPCKGAQLYATALALGNLKTLEPGATSMAERCAPPTETPQPRTATSTLTPTMTGTLFTPTPTIAPSNTGAAPATPTNTGAAPTATPSPSEAPAASATPTPTTKP